MQFPKRDETAVIAVHPVKIMFGPAALHDGRDFNFDEVETHRFFIKFMDCRHVADCQRKVVISHYPIISDDHGGARDELFG